MKYIIKTIGSDRYVDYLHLNEKPHFSDKKPLKFDLKKARIIVARHHNRIFVAHPAKLKIIPV